MNLSEAVEEIKERIDIVEYISEFLDLKKAGSNFKALCPFHSEKTPSFVVSPAKQIFHCFGCGVGGDLISFVMKYEGLEFYDAIKILADRAGVRIQSVKNTETSRRSLLIEIHRAALKFFVDKLKNNRMAMDYLKSRGVSLQSIEDFQLGYAPKEKKALYEYLIHKGFNKQDILASGLCKIVENDVKDTFRDRLIFPIINTRGEPIAFGGRVIRDDAFGPKYLNSPETFLFNKSRELFGLYQARREIAQKNYAILMEGYFDVISAHQYGFRNAVAPLGTALTETQLKKLGNLTKKILLVFDGDEAGIKASKRALSLIYSTGMTAKVLLLERGSDPDSFLKQHGAEAFRSKFKSVKGLVDFYLSLPGERVDKIKELTAILARIDDPIIKADLIRELSEKTGISETYLNDELRRQVFDVRKGTNKIKRDISHIPTPEELIIMICINYPEYITKIKQMLEPDQFRSLSLRRIYEKIIEQGELKNIHELLTPDEISHFTSIMMRFNIDEDMIEKNIQDCVKKIKSHVLKKRLKEIEMEIKMAEKEGDERLLSELQHTLQNLLKEGVNEGIL